MALTVLMLVCYIIFNWKKLTYDSYVVQETFYQESYQELIDMGKINNWKLISTPKSGIKYFSFINKVTTIHNPIFLTDMIHALTLNSQDLIVNSLLQLLHIFVQISYENLVIDQDSSFYLISLNILITCLLNIVLWILQGEVSY